MLTGKEKKKECEDEDDGREGAADQDGIVTNGDDPAL